MKIDFGSINRIVVRVPNWIGDVVMSIPALEALKRNFPKSYLTVISKPWVKDLLIDHPSVSELLIYSPERNILQYLRTIFEIGSGIRQRDFDMAVIFQNAFEAAFLMWLGGVRIRVGYCTDGRGLFLTHSVPRPRQDQVTHQVEYYLNILREMGLEAPSKAPVLVRRQDLGIAVRDMLRSSGFRQDHLTVGLGPGAMYGEAKRWPAERFALVADMAAREWNANILVLGSKKEKQIGDRVQRAMAHRCVNLCGKTSLSDAIELLSICNFFVTNDSGLMHISAALGVPTIAIFGSTDPHATGPLGPKTRVIQHQIDCAPCLRSTCPRDFRCMLSIEASEVWDELKRLRKEVEG